MRSVDLLEALGGLDESLPAAAETRSSARRPARKRMLALTAALLTRLSGMMTALAAENENVNHALYQLWPAMAQRLKPVKLSCEDEGLRMEVISGSVEENRANIFLSMQDLTGDRLGPDADLLDSAALQLPFDGSGTCRLVSYDPQTRTATFLLSITFHTAQLDGGKVTFRVQRFLANRSETAVNMTRYLAEEAVEIEGKPLPNLRGWGSTAESSEQLSPKKEQEAMQSLQVLKPQLDIPLTDGVTLTGIGWLDGVFRVQVRYTDILHTDNHGDLTLRGSDGSLCEAGMSLMDGQLRLQSVCWYDRPDRPDDSCEEYFFSELPKEWDGYQLMGYFTTAEPAVEGNWTVTFPLEELQTKP